MQYTAICCHAGVTTNSKPNFSYLTYRETDEHAARDKARKFYASVDEVNGKRLDECLIHATYCTHCGGLVNFRIVRGPLYRVRFEQEFLKTFNFDQRCACKEPELV